MTIAYPFICLDILKFFCTTLVGTCQRLGLIQPKLDLLLGTLCVDAVINGMVLM